MAQWCSGPERRLPYPRGNWYEDKNWNGFPLAAMKIVMLAEAVFGKDSDKWTDQDVLFYDWLWDASALYEALDKSPETLEADDLALLRRADEILKQESAYLHG